MKLNGSVFPESDLNTCKKESPVGTTNYFLTRFPGHDMKSKALLCKYRCGLKEELNEVCSFHNKTVSVKIADLFERVSLLFLVCGAAQTNGTQDKARQECGMNTGVHAQRDSLTFPDRSNI